MTLYLTLRQLDYAVAVARHGGVTAAAEALHVSQPALSVALRELEARLGRPLFLRRPGGRAVPTAFGRGWLAAAEAQLAAITRLAEPDRLEAPPLRLALFEDLAPVCLAPLIARAAALPGLTLETRVLGFEALDAALRRGEADLALTWDLGLGPGVLRQVLARVPPHAVLPPDHPLAALPALRLSDLADQPLILADQGPSLAHLRALFTRAGIAPQVAHRTATLELMRSHAANGLGVGLSYTNPAARVAPDGRPFVTRAIADAGAEPVILAQLDGNALPEAATGLAPLLAALFTGPAFPDLVVP